MGPQEIKEKLLGKESITKQDYKDIYDYSIENSEEFWGLMSDQIDWIKKPTKISNYSFKDPISIKWYEDGVLNVCYNCVDRHAEKTPDKIAFIHEGNDPFVDRKITYKQLKGDISKLSNLLKSRGVKKGDRVTIYMPMIPEAAMAMLACARIGAVHCVVFGGFSPEALKKRIVDSKSNIVITANEGIRGTKTVPLKENVNEAIDGLDIHTVLTYRLNESNPKMKDGRDIIWQDEVIKHSSECDPEQISSEDPLFILYTSGSTGSPKGILHSSAGYLVYSALTFKTVFDYKNDDIFWCSADVGWITGHSYCVYGALANGATSVLFEGIPNYPDPSRFWQIIDKYNISIFYTAPTAIRALLAAGDEYVKKTSRSSLRILGTVGEPINKEAWEWYYNVIGNGNCPIVDTWWQTETGGHLMTPLPCFDLKPGSAMRPFFGIEPVLIDKDGNEVKEQGKLCFRKSWPSQMRGVYGDNERFKNTYFSDVKNMYFSGDGAKCDDDGDFWITGRMDDVLNVSGHRLGTAEIEDAINLHPSIAESAVIGIPHSVKGEAIFAYIIPKKGSLISNDINSEITKIVRDKIGAIASPQNYLTVTDLPKTRSGKIMRRILRKIAVNDFNNLGDISTLANPQIVEDLIKTRKSKELA